MQSSESRSTLIKHLRHELENVKESCAKYEQLNAAMTELEHGIKSIKEEKDAENEAASTRDREIAEKIREAEVLHAELREESREAEQIAAENKTKLEKLNSELAFLDGKEAGLAQKIENISGFIEDLSANHNNLKDGIDFTKKELAEMKANFSNIEKEQMTIEDKLSKHTLSKKNLLATLADLEATERRLSQLKTEKAIEKDQTTLRLQKKLNQLMDLNTTLAQLEEQSQYVDAERKRIHEAHVETEHKRVQEESVLTDMQGDLNNLETKCRNTDDEQRIEDQKFTKACDSLNDERERFEKNQREAEKLRVAYENMETICGRVGFDQVARHDRKSAKIGRKRGHSLHREKRVTRRSSNHDRQELPDPAIPSKASGEVSSCDHLR